VRSVEPHILQKFIPAGLGVLQAGQATDEGDSLGAIGAAVPDDDAGGTAPTGRGVGFLAMTVVLPGVAAGPAATGAGATGRGATTGFAPSLGGSGAGAAIVFCGPADGLVSGNRPASGLGRISGMRQPQFWQNAAPSRT